MAHDTSKASYRNLRVMKSGAVLSADHPTLEELRSRQDHIDQERFFQNVYAQWTVEGQQVICPSFSGKAQELEIYKHFFNDSLASQNERYEANRQYKRIREMNDIITNKTKAPMETLFQIGKEGMQINPQDLWEISTQIMQEIYETTKQIEGDRVRYQPLNLSMHRDETTDHCHGRGVFMARNEQGQWEPNQNAVLEAMGYELPDPTKPRSRYNNLIMSFTADVRERFYELCEERGYAIDREVQNHGKSYLTHQQFKIAKQQETIAKNEQAIAEQEAKLNTLRASTKTREQINKDLVGAYEALDGVKPIPLSKDVRISPKGLEAVQSALSDVVGLSTMADNLDTYIQEADADARVQAAEASERKQRERASKAEQEKQDAEQKAMQLEKENSTLKNDKTALENEIATRTENGKKTKAAWEQKIADAEQNAQHAILFYQEAGDLLFAANCENITLQDVLDQAIYDAQQDKEYNPNSKYTVKDFIDDIKYNLREENDDIYINGKKPIYRNPGGDGSPVHTHDEFDFPSLDDI